jgi:hypothetical protein
MRRADESRGGGPNTRGRRMGFVTVSEASPGIKYCRIRNQERRVERRQEEETVSAFIAGGTGVDAAMIIDGGERRFLV